ncbi:hypothetical protein H2248_012223 [Termitomyces sp. 'cryptogamus']|nr:hypothetical protein H2248_012223 [Termitomyces sp. 'cryptogamus']
MSSMQLKHILRFQRSDLSYDPRTYTFYGWRLTARRTVLYDTIWGSVRAMPPLLPSLSGGQAPIQDSCE